MPKIQHLKTASRVVPRTAGLAAALVLLAACASGSGSGATGQVASIPSSGGSAGSAGARAAASPGHPAPEGPTVADNANPAQMKAAYGPWTRCLGAHGTPLAMNGKFPGIGWPTGNITAAARNACLSLQPHPPWQQIPADNPNYNLDMAKWINCMNARGVAVKATSGGPTAGGWTFTSPNEPADENQVETQCEMQAFGD